MNLLTIFSFIARLLWSCGIWCLVYSEFIGLYLCLPLGFLLAGKVDLVTIVVEIYGGLFLIVCCGASGRREIVGALKTSSAPYLTSSSYFSELYWTGSLCGGTILFLLFWIFLIFVMFAFDLFPPVYPLCTWVSLSFLPMKFYYLSKKKKINENTHTQSSREKGRKCYKPCLKFQPIILQKSNCYNSSKLIN